MIFIGTDDPIASAQIIEGANDHAMRARITQVLVRHYGVAFEPGATAVLHEREPHVVVSWSPGIGEAGLVVVTFTP
jgi:hypothetical protein